MYSRVWIAILTLLLSAPSAWAWPPTFGAEFTFTNREILLAQLNWKELSQGEDWKKAVKKRDLEKMIDEINWNEVSTDESIAYLNRFEAAILQKCSDCRATESFTKLDQRIVRFEYPDGWWFEIGTDPAVIEVRTKASTLEEYERLQSRMQTDIFDVAKQVKLTPEPILGIGQGHIHIGLESGFGNDPLLFRNFLVDCANHPELAYIFGRSPKNAALLSDLPKKNQNAFARLIRDFDNGKIRTIRSLAEKLQKTVYTRSFDPLWKPPAKFQNVNVTRIVNPKIPLAEKTTEHRSHRPQKSADEFIQQIRLYQARIEYLQKQTGPLPVRWTRPLKAREVVERFSAYLTESGLDWKRDGIPHLTQTKYIAQAALTTDASLLALKQGVLSNIERIGSVCSLLFKRAN